jgi:DNA-binding MarR family transcriptional regulator
LDREFDESILRSLRRISRAIDLHSRQLAARYKLTGPQLICLRELERTDEMRSGVLAQEVNLSQPTVTGILDRLEARELVQRKRDDKDKRRVLVTITPTGSKLVAHAPTPLHKQFADRLAKLSPDQQATIDRVLAQIVEMMSADDLDAAPVMTAGPATAVAGEVVEFLTPEQPAPAEQPPGEDDPV